MQRLGEEKFSSSPLVYSSTFSISSHVLKGRTGIVTSDRSGLGWSFRLVKSSTSTESSKNGGNGSWDGCKSVNVPTDSRDSPVAPSKPPPPPARPSSSPDTVGKARVTLCMEPWVVLLSNCMTIRKITCEVNSNSRLVSLLTKESLPLSSTIELGTFKYDLPPQGINTSYLILYTTIELFQNAESSPKDIRSLAVSTISDSIESGESPDVKFVLYTKRSRPHGASSPKAVFAMSSVLYAYGCNDLNLFFTAGGFKCSEVVAVDLYHPTSEDKRTNDYEYDSDSDLEDEDESSLPISEFAPSNEVNGDRKHPQAGESNKDGDSTSTNSLTVLERLKTIEAEENIKFLRTGRIVFIRDTAYKTWKALVKYIYFDEIQFNQLLSSYPPKSCASGCSPKSMYRVADKFGILPLQKLALKSIKSQLSTTNIGREVFSRFTSWYPEVAEIEVAFVLENYSSGEVRQSVMQAVENIGTGDYAHAVHALKKILNGLQAIPTPPSISVPPKPRPKPTATPVPIGQNQ